MMMMMMKSLYLLVILSMLYNQNAFPLLTEPRLRKNRQITVLNADKNSLNSLPQLISKICISAATVSLSLSLMIPPSLSATDAPLKLSALESNIVKLEQASNRADAIQSFADLYESAGAKTLLVRTKYKYRIVKAINEKRVQLSNVWDNVLSYESGELKRRVDPLRTVDLSPYLSVAPWVGGVCYLAAIFVQQVLPELFVFAYPAAVFVFAAPIAFIILAT